ncbi:MAG TPA: hypothetical protein VFB37_00945 [Steroidobacteraceae bacterium]|nr:hypothetical protein [Steroidobacteraceae bacterium]
MGYILILLTLSATTGEGRYTRIQSFDTEAQCEAHFPLTVQRPQQGEVRVYQCVTGPKPEPKKPPGDHV